MYAGESQADRQAVQAAAGSVTRMLTHQHSAGTRFRFSLTTGKQLDYATASHLEKLASELKRTSAVSIFPLTING